MGIIITVLLAVIILLILSSTGIFLWATKLFKIENSNYKEALKIIVLAGLASGISGLIAEIIGLDFLVKSVSMIVNIYAVHYLLKKYYQSSWKKSVGIYATSMIVTSILFAVITIFSRAFIMSPFVVAGESMVPTYNANDYLLINKFNKTFSRGDIVVYKVDEDSNAYLIKRIIGVPGDRVEIVNGDVIVNGTKLEESYVNEKTQGDTNIIVDSGKYFVMGDKRSLSYDSRQAGAIPLNNIEGKVFYKITGLIK